MRRAGIIAVTVLGCGCKSAAPKIEHAPPRPVGEGIGYFSELIEGEQRYPMVSAGNLGGTIGVNPRGGLLWRRPIGWDSKGEEKVVMGELELAADDQQTRDLMHYQFPTSRWLPVLDTTNGAPGILVVNRLGQSQHLSYVKRDPLLMITPGRLQAKYSTRATIDGNEADNRAVNSVILRLIDACEGGALNLRKSGFPPFGTTSDLYFGHVFWDMDTWIMPAVALFSPQSAKAMSGYRLDRLRAAQSNYDQYFKLSKRSASPGGMMFPWESSVSGRETVPGESKKEHHITGSVIWGLTFAERLGILSSGEVTAAYRGAAKFFEARSDKTERGLEIRDVMSPDEFHIGDNDLYTNVLAGWILNGRTYSRPLPTYLPQDAQSFLNYEKDNVGPSAVYKQAAAMLAAFPLQFPEAERQALKMLQRFDGKYTKNGPAMTECINATVEARFGDKESAYKRWRTIVETHMDQGALDFAEKPNSARTYFYTGAAGMLNTVLYGFCGFRIDEKPVESALYTSKLKSGAFLCIKPNLPAAWKKISLKRVYWDGVPHDVQILGSSVTVTALKE